MAQGYSPVSPAYSNVWKWGSSNHFSWVMLLSSTSSHPWSCLERSCSKLNTSSPTSMLTLPPYSSLVLCPNLLHLGLLVLLPLHSMQVLLSLLYASCMFNQCSPQTILVIWIQSIKYPLASSPHHSQADPPHSTSTLKATTNNQVDQSIGSRHWPI